MELSGKSVLITGGANGIGAALAEALASRGCRLTLADVDASAGEATAARLRAAGAACVFVRCDVTDAAQQAAAFAAHVRAHGGLDVAVLNAGIEENPSFLDSDEAQLRRVLDINFTGVATGVRLAVAHWRETRSPGVVLVTASAAGLYPLSGAEIYSAAKAGAVQLVRSLAHLQRESIRCVALCPQFAATALVDRMRASAPAAMKAKIEAAGGGILSLPEVISAALLCLTDESNAGRALFLTAGSPGKYWEFAGERAQAGRPRPPLRAPSALLASWAASPPPPPTCSAVIITRLSNDFRAASSLRDNWPVARAPLPKGRVLVRRVFAGINASDVNFSSGRYFGSEAAATARLPFVAGFETTGIIASLGPGVRDSPSTSWLEVGTVVGSLSYGGFAEYGLEDASSLLPLPSPSPQHLALLTSGLTASVALEQAAALRPGDTVLVTAAAGGTGQFAVQLASLAGARVVATCGSAAKAALLRRLLPARSGGGGAGVPQHVVIDYSSQDVKAVLKAECPKGVDVVFESVGGDMFDVALNALAPRGRLVVIGQMSQYAGGWATPSSHPGLAEKLLWRSASVVGFFLPLHARHFARHTQRLCALLASGQLQSCVDPTPFVGLASAADAVEHLQGGKSIGKVVLQVAKMLPPNPDAKM